MLGRLIYLILGVGCEILAIVLFVRGPAMAAHSRRRMAKPGSFRAGTPSYVSIAIMAGNVAVLGIYFFNRFLFK